LLRNSMPTWRLLYWSSPADQALQSIVERNVHFAAVNIPVEGHDPVHLFAKQLQEPMHRYRVFSRTSGILLREPTQNRSLKDLPKDTRIAIPKGKLLLWQGLLEKDNIDPDHFLDVDPGLSERQMIDAFSSSRWDAIFVDVRYLKDDTALVLTAREHLDFVIPDSYMDLPPVRKLIELLLSEEFWMWLETQTGCDISQRGLVE
jgi:molybdate-binding protein